MGNLSKTELNLMHFYRNPNLLLDLWKDLAKLFQKQIEVKKKRFGEVMREINIWPLSTQRRGVTYNELDFVPRYFSENENNS